jgi:hypothetical protein
MDCAYLEPVHGTVKEHEIAKLRHSYVYNIENQLKLNSSFYVLTLSASLV